MVCVFVHPAGAVSAPGGVPVCGRRYADLARFAALLGLFAPLVGIFWRIFMHNILPHRHWEALAAIIAVVCFISIGVLLAL